MIEFKLLEFLKFTILFSTVRVSYECLITENMYSQCGLPLSNVESGTKPWVVSLTCSYKLSADEIDKMGHICGGTIISNRHVITAAHCLQVPNVYIDKKYHINPLNPNIESIFTIAVEIPNTKDFVYYKIKKAYIHEGFDNKTLLNDIALIELEKELEFNNHVQSVCLPDQEIQGYPNIGTDSYLIAWNNRDIYSMKNEIKQIDMAVVSDDYCSKFSNSDLQLCAKALRANSACKGDSGGPLIVQNRFCGENRKCNVIAGITSYVLGKRSDPYECNSLFPTFFTRVAAYTPWIKANMFNAYDN